MSFLQPFLLIGLPLAMLPVIIHLINRHRHQTVNWAAMMFLFDARKMNRGMARLRQVLILAMRVIAVAMLIFAASRPLSGGWLALSGGNADTIILLLDRSSSMELQILETGESKRSAALTKLTDLISKTGNGSEIVLIDSATLTPTIIPDTSVLADLPQTAPTDTAADIPGLLQVAVDYLTTNESGRTDIWLASDQRQSDWKPSSGQWQSLRTDLVAGDAVRLFLLNFPETESSNLSISTSNVQRQNGPEGMQLMLDLSIQRTISNDDIEALTIPVEFTINGTRTVQEMTITGSELVRLGHIIPLGNGAENGWGRVDLPADDNLLDNTGFFVFDEPAARKTVIISEDTATIEAITAAAASPVDPAASYDAVGITPDKAAEIPWQDTALLFWHAAVPSAESTMGALLRQHVASGRSLVFLPPLEDETGSDNPVFGFEWKEWLSASKESLGIGWWRTESGLLANTQNGDPLPAGDLKLFKSRLFSGDGQALLKATSGEPVISELITDSAGTSVGSLYAWGTLPRTDHSTLATDGIAFFIMVHRALEAGANAVSGAQFRQTAPDALPSGDTVIAALSSASDDNFLAAGLRSGAYQVTPRQAEPYFVALNRPDSEDSLKLVSTEALTPLLEGVDYRQIDDELGSGSSLAAEVWRAFLIAMALALIAEAALCVPARPKPQETPVGLAPPNPVK